MSRKQTPLCLLCTIVERGGGQRAFRTYEKHGIALHYRISGEGTASSDLLDLLGFGTSERDILISPARRSAVDALVEEIHRDGSHMRAKGILFVLPRSAPRLPAPCWAPTFPMQRRELPWSRTPKNRA